MLVRERAAEHGQPGCPRPLGHDQGLPGRTDRLVVAVKQPERADPVGQQHQPQVGCLVAVADHRQRPVDRVQRGGEVPPDEAHLGQRVQQVPGGERVGCPLRAGQGPAGDLGRLVKPPRHRQHERLQGAQPARPHLVHARPGDGDLQRVDRLARVPGPQQAVGHQPGDLRGPVLVTAAGQQPASGLLHLVVLAEQERHRDKASLQRLPVGVAVGHRRDDTPQQLPRYLRHPVGQHRQRAGQPSRHPVRRLPRARAPAARRPAPSAPRCPRAPWPPGSAAGARTARPRTTGDGSARGGMPACRRPGLPRRRRRRDRARPRGRRRSGRSPFPGRSPGTPGRAPPPTAAPSPSPQATRSAAPRSSLAATRAPAPAATRPPARLRPRRR